MTISATNVWRRYGAGDAEVTVLAGINFDVGRGETFALLGPNGSGKSTLVKILASLLLPDAGQVFVDGVDVVRDSREARRLTGLALGGDTGFFPYLSAVENLHFYAALHGVRRRAIRDRTDEILGQWGLDSRSRQRVAEFSRGMKQRLHIARALLLDPPVLLLDEPTLGLDPIGAEDLRTELKALAASGRTIFLTTHDLDDVKHLADGCGILHCGSLGHVSDPHGLFSLAPVSGGVTVRVAEWRPSLVSRLEAIDGVRSVSVEKAAVDETIIEILAMQPTRVLAEVTQRLAGDTLILETKTREVTFSDVYRSLIEQRTAVG